MRVLITGAFGFIGRHLLPRLLEEVDTEVFLLDRERQSSLLLPTDQKSGRSHSGITHTDLRDYEQVRQAINSIEPDVIFHLAAAGVGDPFLTVEDAINHNLYGTLNLLRTAFAGEATAHQPQRIIISRTPGEYSAMNPYAASKSAAWQFCRMYTRTHGWPIVGAAIFQAYGPGQPEGRLLPAAIIAALNGQDFPMTAGKQERDWIYMADVVSGLLAIRDAELAPGSTIELGSGQLTSVVSIVQQAYALIGGKGKPQIGVIPTRPGEEPVQRADADRAYELTGWRTRVSLHDGISKMVAYLKNPQSRLAKNTQNL
jgi:nucleoside-diphosphate-sugar epimerase